MKAFFKFRSLIALIVIGIALALAVSVHMFGASTVSEQRYIVQQECDNPDKNSSFQWCAILALKKKIVADGLPAGMHTLRTWYTSSEVLRPMCDRVMRGVGLEIGKSGVDYRSLDITKESVWCNYGFYHGYITAVMSDTSDIQKGFEICDYVGSKLSSTAPGARPECIRAVAYGISDVLGSQYKDPESIAQKGVSICTERKLQKEEFTDCVMGIFAELGRMLASGDHGQIKDQHYLYICDNFSDDIATICYGGFKWFPLEVLGVGQLDVVDGYKTMVQKLGTKLKAEQNTVGQLIYTLSYNQALNAMATSSRSQYQEGIDQCMSIPEYFMQPCINAYALGVAKGGLPGSQYHEVAAFCKQAESIPYDPKECLKDAAAYLKVFYSADVLRSACSEFEKKLNVSC